MERLLLVESHPLFCPLLLFLDPRCCLLGGVLFEATALRQCPLVHLHPLPGVGAQQSHTSVTMFNRPLSPIPFVRDLA